MRGTVLNRALFKGGFSMKNLRVKIIGVLVMLALTALYYYITLPAINVHSSGFWTFLMLLVVTVLVIYVIRKRIRLDEMKESKGVKTIVGVLAAIILVYLIGSLLSSPIINAKKYQQLLKVDKGEFTRDIKELSYDQIPLLDRNSATILGNRKMGSMIDMASQFEVDELYSQINYNDKPVRVSPLRYASTIKWLTNHSDGIPAYMMIDMATQTTELVKLDEGIKYSTAEYFNRNIYRHLRFNYPTYIFNELSFEIDEEGTPYWVCPVKKFNIGLFGGETVGRVVLCNAITGETENYSIEDVPTWIDRAYSADLLISLYDYYGTLKHGYFNSILGQKDCLVTTDGYNYLAIDDDVWVYTGVTSVSSDESNVGFVLMNQRTMETKFYEIAGAEEYSAMDSAEGQVQNLNYEATFPLLLNISDEPTYLISLKDAAGLVKKYAMVNVEKYQVVGIGDTVAECEAEYQELLLKEGIQVETDDRESGTITGVIRKIVQGVVAGDSHYFIMLENSDEIYDVSVVKFIEIIKYEIGQEITLDFKIGENSNTVIEIKPAHN